MAEKQKKEQKKDAQGAPMSHGEVVDKTAKKVRK